MNANIKAPARALEVEDFTQGGAHTAMSAAQSAGATSGVSYTHLTLPAKRAV
ncbi:hypothetical protein [Pseudomonas aeruginosa]|uniref:hypothetical protein n=1 Tax=Pseudomonas aeruginosa TaxID=287 RepID=UPI0015BED9A8|nr:hypothetical protein [Pseudomonas aeruginosa]